MNGQASAFVTVGSAADCDVQADKPTGAIEQWPATKARLDQGITFDEVVVTSCICWIKLILKAHGLISDDADPKGFR